MHTLQSSNLNRQKAFIIYNFFYNPFFTNALGCQPIMPTTLHTIDQPTTIVTILYLGYVQDLHRAFAYTLDTLLGMGL